MKSRRLSIVALLSLALAVLLLYGYVSRAGMELDYTGSGPASHHRMMSLGLDEGRVQFWCNTYDPPFTTNVGGTKLRWIGHPFQLRAPSIRRSLWEFDAHELQAAKLSQPRIVLVAFPIWCLLFPCLIAPLLWFRARRRKEERGFPVDTATPPAAATI